VRKHRLPKLLHLEKVVVQINDDAKNSEPLAFSQQMDITNQKIFK